MEGPPGREPHSVSLTFPPSFGSAYVGELFSCTLCANNELEEDSERQVSNIKLGAEMQTPSGTLPLELAPNEDSSGNMKPQETVQRNMRFDLREEGSHTLAVNLSYSETMISKDHSASSGRVRTFRKLYQFIARPCLNVRTKVSTFGSEAADETKALALEAQIDNLADSHIVLKSVVFNPKPAFKAMSLNWDAYPLEKGEYTNCPAMAPRDVHQIAFLVQQVEGTKKEVTRDGRTLLGQLGLRWCSSMGEQGFLTTGMLTTKRR
ncbi:MAG: hypothetical protein Q9217_005451 [Psora testacea]